MRSFLLLLVFCWSSQACKTKPQQTGNPQQSLEQQQQQSIASLESGQQQFTNRLLQQIESNTSTNFVLSPHSIHSVFSQLLQGSGGRTKAELENLLGVTASDSLMEQFRILGQGLSGEDFKQANLLAVANNFKPKREYRLSLNNGFQSEIREFNFSSKSRESVQEINQFVEDATSQKIKDLLGKYDVDVNTRMVLVNAVYFKAKWQIPFNVRHTFSGNFNSPNGSKNVQYMNTIADMRVLDDKERGLKILELPYENPNRSMLIVLPDGELSTENIARRLEGLDFSSIRTNEEPITTHIIIPKFELEFKTDLKEQMEQLGVRDLFFQHYANLSGISNDRLYVSKGVHQAFIKVDEEGTEAAAATAAVVRTESLTPLFYANGPFLFIVYDFEHKTTLFAGKVVDPNKAGVQS